MNIFLFFYLFLFHSYLTGHAIHLFSNKSIFTFTVWRVNVNEFFRLLLLFVIVATKLNQQKKSLSYLLNRISILKFSSFSFDPIESAEPWIKMKLKSIVLANSCDLRCYKEIFNLDKYKFWRIKKQYS